LAGADVVTYEHEHLPAESVEWLAERTVVRPGGRSLREVQNRVTQRRLLSRVGVGQADHVVIDDREIAKRGGGEQALRSAVERIGAPGILKTATGGYDGKGQFRIESSHQCAEAWSALNPETAVYERFVDFERELSIVGVRGADGAKRFYPIIESVHERGILVQTIAPAPGEAEVVRSLQAQAESHVSAIVDELGHIGAFALELFQIPGHAGPRVIANEFAGRVHNTGHWTIEGAETSQFANHLRAITGRDLGSTAMSVGASAMMNFIGALPDEAQIASFNQAGAFYHDYGKRPAPGRKVGHVTVCAPDSRALHGRFEALSLTRGTCRTR
jgi:5-(carboxyamino)imidazole ribonucleotide synthase